MPQEILAPQEGFEKFARKSKRELFLDRMEQVMPWGELLALVESHDLSADSSQPPVGLPILHTAVVQPLGPRRGGGSL